MRKPDTPLFVEQLTTFYETDAIFSPDFSVIVSGSSVKRDSPASGKLCYYSTATFELLKEEDLGTEVPSFFVRISGRVSCEVPRAGTGS